MSIFTRSRRHHQPQGDDADYIIVEHHRILVTDLRYHAQSIVDREGTEAGLALCILALLHERDVLVRRTDAILYER